MVDEDERIGGSIPSPCILLIIRHLRLELRLGHSRSDSTPPPFNHPIGSDAAFTHPGRPAREPALLAHPRANSDLPTLIQQILSGPLVLFAAIADVLRNSGDTKSHPMSVQRTENSIEIALEIDPSTAGDLDTETVEKTGEQAIVNPGLRRTLEPGAPRIVLGILLLAALGVLFFAFSSCF